MLAVLGVSTILNQCDHTAARTNDCQFQGYHKALMHRRGYKRALVATSHKLLPPMWAVLRDECSYRDPEIDYEALMIRRNARRWLRQLDQHGYLDMLLRAIANKTST